VVEVSEICPENDIFISSKLGEKALNIFIRNKFHGWNNLFWSYTIHLSFFFISFKIIFSKA